LGKNINLPRFPEKNGPELSCGRNLPFGKVNADAGSVAKRGIELNNESGDLRRRKSHCSHRLKHDQFLQIVQICD